jgi:signal peptidase I
MPREPWQRSTGRPLVLTVALVLALSIAAAVTARGLRRVIWVTRVTSWSMSPALRPGQLVMTRRFRPGGRLRRGDIVVADSAELGRRIVKRVAGLPGDRIRIDRPVTYRGGPAADFLVPRDAVLLLGDNRAASSDSRSWAQPYLPIGSIRGRLLGRRSWWR